jgi:hypothetical protein
MSSAAMPAASVPGILIDDMDVVHGDTAGRRGLFVGRCPTGLRREWSRRSLARGSDAVAVAGKGRRRWDQPCELPEPREVLSVSRAVALEGSPRLGAHQRLRRAGALGHMRHIQPVAIDLLVQMLAPILAHAKPMARELERPVREEIARSTHPRQDLLATREAEIVGDLNALVSHVAEIMSSRAPRQALACVRASSWTDRGKASLGRRTHDGWNCSHALPEMTAAKAEGPGLPPIGHAGRLAPTRKSSDAVTASEAATLLPLPSRPFQGEGRGEGQPERCGSPLTLALSPAGETELERGARCPFCGTRLASRVPDPGGQRRQAAPLQVVERGDRLARVGEQRFRSGSRRAVALSPVAPSAGLTR